MTLDELRHVLWIGGGSRSGKTTIARRLARRYGLRWYSSDAQTWRHRDRAVASRHPAALRFESLSFEEREECTPTELLDMGLHEERGPMVVEDLRRLPTSPLVVAEGSTVPAFVVSAGIAAPGRAVWLIPTPAFGETFVQAPPQARPLLVETWRLGVARIAGEVTENRAPVEVVDGSRGLDEMTSAVEERFAEALAEGPCADTLDERRALLRESNDQILAQCLGFIERPWSGGDPATYRRDFVCECDDPRCEALLELTVAEAARRLAAPEPLLAHATASVGAE